ncbi:MAG TPA: phosphoribosylglycinamide formyltransferase [Planctomycetes bacterium]|nr:phosphoribosylglycinamide formyltransferase [Planctomycetota bacterium]
MAEPYPVAVLLSGSGTTLENFFALMDKGALNIDVRLVVSSRPDAYGIERAQKRGIPAHVFRRRDYASLDEYTAAVFVPVRASGAKLVLLAGFMVQIAVLPDFKNRIMNVHPALIPAFCGKGLYGHYAHEAVIKSGVKISGCTVHFVDDEYDHGQIIVQRPVPVYFDDTPDTLAERVQAEERIAYPEAVRLFIEGRLEVVGNRVKVKGA